MPRQMGLYSVFCRPMLAVLAACLMLAAIPAQGQAAFWPVLDDPQTQAAGATSAHQQSRSVVASYLPPQPQSPHVPLPVLPLRPSAPAPWVYYELTATQIQAWVQVALYQIDNAPEPVRVLEFHNIGRYNRGRFYLQPTQFEALLLGLQARGYWFIDLETYRQYLSGRTLPPRVVLLTFDDGHQEHYSVVRPILLKYHLPGVFFVVGGYTDAPYFLSSAQIRQMSSEGFDISAHSMRHEAANRRARGDAAILADFAQTRAKLESLIGHPVTSMAYPYGVYDAQVEKLAEQAGYDLSFAAWQIKGPKIDPLAAGRMEVRGDWYTLPVRQIIPPKIGR